jgi:hypothetical protein
MKGKRNSLDGLQAKLDSDSQATRNSPPGIYPKELRSVSGALIVFYKVLPLELYQIHLELGH